MTTGQDYFMVKPGLGVVMPQQTTAINIVLIYGSLV